MPGSVIIFKLFPLFHQLVGLYPYPAYTTIMDSSSLPCIGGFDVTIFYFKGLSYLERGEDAHGGLYAM
jgi:hypothetical protein